MLKLKVSKLVKRNDGVEFYDYVGVYKNKTVDEIKSMMENMKDFNMRVCNVIGYKIFTTDEKKKQVTVYEERY